MKDINLLPEESNVEVEAKAQKIKNPASMRSIMIVLMFFVIIILTYILPVVYIKYIDYTIGSLNNSLNSKVFNEVKNIKLNQAKNEEKMKNKLAVINDINDKNVYLSDLLTAIDKAKPAGCTINSIKYKDGSFDVSGKASMGIIAAEFMNNIDRMDYIEAKSINDGMEVNSVAGETEFEYTFSIVGKGEK